MGIHSMCRGSVSIGPLDTASFLRSLQRSIFNSLDKEGNCSNFLFSFFPFEKSPDLDLTKVQLVRTLWKCAIQMKGWY